MIVISHAAVKADLVIYTEIRLSESKQVSLPCAVFIFCLVLFSFLYVMFYCDYVRVEKCPVILL